MGFGVLVLATLGASADAGRVSAQYQGYGLAGGQGQDPYANDNPQDVHVDGFGGQPVVNGYLRINLDSLPSGSTINGLRLTLVPNGTQSDNVNAAQAVLRACILDQPLTSNGFQSSPPPYDCNAVHADGEPQNDGSWVFEIGPLGQRWSKTGNTGLALVAYLPPNGTSVAVSPTAWAVAFDHTKTAAAVDYTPPAASALGVPAQPTPGSASSQSSSGGSASGAAAPPPATTVTAPSVVPPPANNPAPVVHPAPAVPQPTPAAAPSATPAPSPDAAAAPLTAASSPPPSSPQPQVNDRWVVLTATLGGAALLMLVVGAGQHVLRPSAMGLGARLVSAFSASRSQFATPVAVLALASVFALGFTGATPNLLGAGTTTGSGGATALGGSGTGSGGGATGPAPGAPGSNSSGVSAPGAAGPASSGLGPASSQPAPGSTQPGAASGQPGVTVSTGGASATPGTSNGGLDGPGVTSTTVRIGFIYVSDQQAANNLFGLKVPSTGNQQAEEQTLVDYVNKHGGIAGRRIQPVYVAYSNSQAETDPTINEEICHTMTEDYHVFAVIGGAGPPDDANANSCYAQAGTLNFDAEQASPDLTFLRQASPYIWMTDDGSLDRTMRWEIAGLKDRGFFSNSPGSKLGVVVAEDPVNERVWQQVTLPALQAAGISSPDKFEVPHDTLDDTANTMKQAVIHFQANGDTNVIFQGGGQDGDGSYAVLFLLSAESQHYNPRYGFSSDDGPVALVQNVPQDQFQGPGGPALAVGTIPGVDTDDQHYGQWPTTPGEKQCASIEAAGGNSFTSREGALAIILFCDAVFELQDGAQALNGQPLNAQLWADQAMKLGSNVFNAGLYSRYVGPNHWDSAGGYRLLHAVQNCEGSSACFEYDNPNTYT